MHFLGKCFKNELIYDFSTGFKNKTYILNYIRLSYTLILMIHALDIM